MSRLIEESTYWLFAAGYVLCLYYMWVEAYRW